MLKAIALSLVALSSSEILANGGTCWYFNRYTKKVVDFDAFGKRHSCDPHANWYEQCRDYKPVTKEVGCHWNNAPAPRPSPSDMPVDTGMGSGNQPIDMPVDGGMSPGGSMGTQVPYLSSLGISISNGRQNLPANWQQVKAAGVRVDSSYQACNWATRPVTYAFPDGVIYANAQESDINVFDHQTVRKFGCLMPAVNGVSVQQPIQEPLNPNNTYAGEGRNYVAASLASYGIAVDNKAHGRDGRFAEIVSNGLRISQENHKCKWAVLPLIYVFTDGIVYASIGGNEMNVFTHDTARSQGCFVPRVSAANPSNPMPSQEPDMSTNGNMPVIDNNTGMDMGGAGADGLSSMGSDM